MEIIKIDSTTKFTFSTFFCFSKSEIENCCFNTGYKTFPTAVNWGKMNKLTVKIYPHSTVKGVG